MLEAQGAAQPPVRFSDADPGARGKGSAALAALLGFALPAFIYALVITRGTLDLLAPEYGWQAYNAYALALAEGRTNVPLKAIGAEGFIVDGRVYMYYGMLPALARWPLMPFIDLAQTPVSLLMTWLFCTAGAAVLQLALLRVYWSKARGAWTDKLLLLAASLGVWLGSGPWLALQNGTFYHEPFAAGLLLSVIAIYMLVDDAVLQARAPSIKRLCVYALLAGLMVFTRQTMAVSFYAVTLALAAAPVLIEGWSRPSVGRTTARMVLPCLILAAFGLTYIWSNVSRFGGDAFPMTSYGFFILFGSLSSDPEFADKFRRLQDIDSIGQFHVSRMFPNLVYYLIGGDEWRTAMIERLGGGYTVAFGRPVRLLASWAGPLLLSLVGLWAALTGPKPLYRFALIAAAGVGGMLQLAYATAASRYATELWPVLSLLMCFGLAYGLQGARGGRGKLLAPALLTVTIVMTAYALKLSPDLRYDYPDKAGSLLQPMPPQLTRLVEE